VWEKFIGAVLTISSRRRQRSENLGNSRIWQVNAIKSVVTWTLTPTTNGTLSAVERMAAMTLSISILGPLVIESSDLSVGPLPSKARALLGFMAAQRGQTVSQLVFDRDPEFSSNRINLFNHSIQRDSRARRLLASIMFADPNVYPGLQCADLLAWETRKDLMQKAGGFKPTKRWRELFTKMPDYTLDYMGEFYNAGEFDRFLPQIIESYQPSASSSPSFPPHP
jgi:hypothetical protein